MASRKIPSRSASSSGTGELTSSRCCS
jgi:hypothetical protein